ncbi:MAG: GDYXXLXY domain-containing protein, partial [Waterburya sp.]
SELQQLPGGNDLSPGDLFYVILAADSQPEKSPPAPWKAIKVTQDLPQDLPQNRVAIKGKVEKYRTISYGLETYYMPESQRKKINQEIRDLQGDSDGNRAFVVEIKVDRRGNAVPISLWVGDNNYRF